MTKDELLALLRLCNADPSAIDAVELAYELGFKAGQAEKSADPGMTKKNSYECPHGMVDTCCSNPLDCYLSPSSRGRNP